MSKHYSKYPKELITAIAQDIDMGMICFLNTDTMEFDSVLGRSYDGYWDGDQDDWSREVYEKVDAWKNSIRIEPPESWESFDRMERFIENSIPDNDAVKSRLRNALSGRQPFQNFKHVINSSKYRQCWFDFKQSQMEQFVLDKLKEYENEASIG